METPLGLPAALGKPMAAAQRAQMRTGFSWRHLDHYRYLDAEGVRFFPATAGVARPNTRRGGRARWLAAPVAVLPALGIADVWTSPDGLPSKVGLTLVLVLVAALGAFMFRALGVQEPAGPDHHGLYVFPEHLVLWLPRAGEPDLRLVVLRQQVRRFFPDASPDDPVRGLRVAFERTTGEDDDARTGLPAGSPQDRGWLERWRRTGELGTASG